jgi:molybdopterin-guanine dinucleotide biosynthesis protein B
MKVFQIIGKHNSGKTTLIEFLAEELQKRGYRVGYIKHDPKGKGITDKGGSDTPGPIPGVAAKFNFGPVALIK